MIQMGREYLGVMMEAGYIYIGMRRYKEARELFEGIAVLAKDSDVPYVALGNCDFCEGKIGPAIKHYQRALEFDPESIFAKVYLGEAFFFSGKKDEAIKLFREVSSKDAGGGAGDFARALLDAIKKGFQPGKKKELKGAS